MSAGLICTLRLRLLRHSSIILSIGVGVHVHLVLRVVRAGVVTRRILWYLDLGRDCWCWRGCCCAGHGWKIWRRRSSGDRRPMTHASHGVLGRRTRPCGSGLISLLSLRIAFCLILRLLRLSLSPSRGLCTPLCSMCFALLELSLVGILSLAELARLRGFLSLCRFRVLLLLLLCLGRTC